MRIKKYAIIVAGGEGNRAGGSIPKQFQKIAGLPMLWWSVRAFYFEDQSTEIILVLHPGFFDDWDILCKDLSEEDKRIPVKIVAGGRSRLESVKNGLYSVPTDGLSVVAIHDAARPMVSEKLISRGWNCALEDGAAVPVVPLSDSIRKVVGGKNLSVPRNEYMMVQTPQVFTGELIKEAYRQPLNPNMTDDASVVEAYGHKISCYPGESENIKVTNPNDLKIANLLLESR